MSGAPRSDGGIGVTTERVWTCIAAEVDGEPVEGAAGQRVLERTTMFAWREDALKWLHEQEQEGFEVGEPVPLATLRYQGETDSPSNAWAARAEKVLG